MEKQKITVDTLEITANEEKQLLRENVKDLQRRGFSLAEILQSLPSGDEAEQYDFGLIICNLNAPTGQKQADLVQELHQTGSEVQELIRRALSYRRCVVVFWRQ